MDNQEVDITSKKISAEDLQKKYIDYLLMHDKMPNSVYAFAKSLDINETDFYFHYNSFKALEAGIWGDWFKKTTDVLNNDPAYPPYTVREKLLAFYYSWLEVLKPNRSFVLTKFATVAPSEMKPPFIKSLKDHFDNYINELLLEGKDSSEVADRPFSGQYDKGFWMQFMFLTRFWINDDSKGYEQTDAAIEKSVNFTLDLIGKGAIDSFIDLAKFLYQNK